MAKRRAIPPKMNRHNTASMTKLFVSVGTFSGKPCMTTSSAPGDSGALTEQQISHLEAAILDLNGVRRDKIMRAGISPTLFFVLLSAVFGVFGLGWAGLRIRPGRRRKVRSQGP